MGTKNYRGREKKKSPKELPSLEDLRFFGHSKLTLPRKNDRQALRRIMAGERYWDRRKIEKLNRRRRARRDPLPAARLSRDRIPEPVLEKMLKLMPSWSWNPESASFATMESPVDRAAIDELVEAGFLVGNGGPMAFRVVGVSEDQLREIRLGFHERSDISIA